MNKAILPSEWHKQSLVQLTWPHKNTDWNYMLKEVEECFNNIAIEILKREKLLIVSPNPDEVRSKLQSTGANLENLLTITYNTNDTWARDHAFITKLDSNNNPILMDFCFNGWGMKFASNLDNQINKNIFKQDIFRGKYENHLDFVLEGGSIESDGNGILLTTSKCLLSVNRNERLSKSEIEEKLKDLFSIKKVLWLNHGYLAGDDTDSHVDTLARLCPNDTIVYVKCEDQSDEHYNELLSMENELKKFTDLKGNSFKLLPLPINNPIFDCNGERIPATYANFLIINNAILYPTYNQPNKDKEAGEVLQKAFPEREIIGIDCLPLIKQHGSLHCVTMQYPEGVI